MICIAGPGLWTGGATPVWEENHNACWERRLLMPGAPHIKATSTSQNTRLDGYANSFLYSNAQFCIISNHITFFCRRRHMVASLAPSSRHMLWPTRARQWPTSPTSWRTCPWRIAMSLSTAASMDTHRWQGRSMAHSMI